MIPTPPKSTLIPYTTLFRSEKKHNYSVFVFDDINWNEGMQKAWKEIKDHPEVTLSIDLFYAGMIFFRKEKQQKEHFVRSEEHTSELQSQSNLVCRLLLEKKN